MSQAKMYGNKINPPHKVNMAIKSTTVHGKYVDSNWMGNKDQQYATCVSKTAIDCDIWHIERDYDSSKASIISIMYYYSFCVFAITLPCVAIIIAVAILPTSRTWIKWSGRVCLFLFHFSKSFSSARGTFRDRGNCRRGSLPTHQIFRTGGCRPWRTLCRYKSALYPNNSWICCRLCPRRLWPWASTAPELPRWRNPSRHNVNSVKCKKKEKEKKE